MADPTENKSRRQINVCDVFSHPIAVVMEGSIEHNQSAFRDYTT